MKKSKYLNVVNWWSQSLKRSVHHLPLASPLLHDAHTPFGLDQMLQVFFLRILSNDIVSAAFCSHFFIMLRLCGIPRVIVVLPHKETWILVCKHFPKHVHHVPVIIWVPVYHHDDTQQLRGILQALDRVEALFKIAGILLVGRNSESNCFSVAARLRVSFHSPVLNKGEQALNQNMEREQESIKAKGNDPIHGCRQLEALHIGPNHDSQNQQSKEERENGSKDCPKLL